LHCFISNETKEIMGVKDPSSFPDIWVWQSIEERKNCFGIGIFPKNLGRLTIFPNIFSV
jgi:hypothetical protein